MHQLQLSSPVWVMHIAKLFRKNNLKSWVDEYGHLLVILISCMQELLISLLYSCLFDPKVKKVYLYL